MKRSVKALMLLVVVALLAGGYTLVSNTTQPDQVSEESGTFDLNAKLAEDIAGLAWTSGGTDFSFTRVDDTWAMDGNAAFPASQSALDALAESLASLTATRKITDVTSPADYGLEEPAFTVMATWNDGSQTVYAMGDATPFADGYYLSLSDQAEVVYTIASSLATAFSKTLTQLADLEALPTWTQATRLTVGDTLDAVWRENGGSLDDDQRWYDSATGEALDNSAVEALLTDASAIAWETLVTAQPSEDELATYQLDDAATAITVYEDDAPVLTLLLGAATDAGDYYARLADSSMVYTVASEDVADLLDSGLDTLYRKDILPLTLDSLAEATFEAEGRTWAFQRTETVLTAATPTDTEAADAEETPEVEVTVTLNGEALDEESLSQLWSTLSSLSATARVTDSATGDCLLLLQATSETGITAELSVYPYDADSYLIPLDEGRSLLVPAETVDKALRMLRQMQ